MRAVVQRVARAHVEVSDEVVGQIEAGLLILLGVAPEDTDAQAAWLADKVANLRIFEDAEGKMNVSLVESGGSALVVSQFTLYGDCRKGRRPSFIGAARPELADRLYQVFCERLRSLVPKVEEGVFQATMAVHLVNDGPVTLILDTP
ncbi:MAG: D-tyrosyl-tRNA(Tyr) deacylase [Candidatus Eremiobacteraeota bacterium]|nr:D-tyrosyl-tRNA(Tyr) deacylase [Candidatus Eremiobacteraeota bacterium]